jgi:two-component system, chemotaxis family, protein-glutamate methylesterase/glutaminase
MSAETFTQSAIRVLIVDDSAFMRTALSRMIGSEAGISVVGTAFNGSDALIKIPELDPDVVTLDVEMPGLNGLETLRAIMTNFPRPVIMVSSVTEANADTTFQALSSGAFDYVPKHLSSNSLEIVHIRRDLISKIRAAATARHRTLETLHRKPVSSSADSVHACTNEPAVIAIGTSTGGPKALQEILPQFPRDLSVPVLIVQHMPRGFTAPFAQRLNSLCAVRVCEAPQGAVLQPGVVYIAPAGLHMTVDRVSDTRYLIYLTPHPDHYLHIPSVDILMQSVAVSFKSRAMGIILTGMGSDGAEGMKAIHMQGGYTVGQDEFSSAVYGMPKACADLRILDRVVPLAQIPAQVLHATRYRKRA